MSDQEMQFADPEWQPTRQRRSTHEQPPYVPVDVNDPPRQQTDGPKDAYDAGKAGGDGDYSRGYQAESSSPISPAAKPAAISACPPIHP